MNAWSWLNANSGGLQSIFAILGVVLTVASIFVLTVTWRAIRRQALASELQADAARALTKVAEEQTKMQKMPQYPRKYNVTCCRANWSWIQHRCLSQSQTTGEI